MADAAPIFRGDESVKNKAHVEMLAAQISHALKRGNYHTAGLLAEAVAAACREAAAPVLPSEIPAAVGGVQ